MQTASTERIAKGRIFVTAALFVAVAAHAFLINHQWFTIGATAMSRHEMRYDFDAPPILASVRAHPTLLSTLRWWSQSWRSDGPYWRPLTMLAFWTEYRLFGAANFAPWIVVCIVMHLICCSMLGAFVYTWTRRFDVAALTLAVYAAPHFTTFMAPPAADMCVRAWKDLPELLTDTVALASLLLLSRGKWYWAVAAAAGAIAFKESGWFVLPIGFVVVLTQGRLRHVPRGFYVAAVCMLLLMVVLREHAGGPVMRPVDSTVSNGHWYNRYFGAVCGTLVDDFFVDPALPLLAAAVVAAGWLISYGRVAAAAVAAAAFVVAGGATNAVIYHYSLLAGTANALDPAMWYPWLIGLVVWLACAVALALSRTPLRRFAAASIVIGLIATIPFVATTGVMSHVLHLAAAFQSIAVACAILAAYEYAVARTSASTPAPANAEAPAAV